MNNMTQQEVKNYIDALNQVKPLSVVPVFGGITRSMAAEYFGTTVTQIESCCAASYNKEIHNNETCVTVEMFMDAGYIKGKRAFTVEKDGCTIGYSNARRAVKLLNETVIANLARKLVNKSMVASRACSIVDGCAITDTRTHNSLVDAGRDTSNGALQIFANEGLGELRVMMQDNEVWFVAKDVSLALGYGNPQRAIRNYVDNDDKGVTKIVTPGGLQNIAIINESGLYSLILSGKLPTAKKFKRWVTKEVLPALRKDGAYITAKSVDDFLMNPDLLIKLAEKRKEELAAMKKLEESNKSLREEVERNKSALAELDFVKRDLIEAKSKLDEANSSKEELESKLAAAKKSAKELSDKVNAYECRDTICALIKAYSYAACGGLKQEADKDFQRELFERHNIDLDLRMKYLGRGKNIVNYLRPDEYDKAANMMISICKQRGVNTDKIICASYKRSAFDQGQKISTSSRTELFSRISPKALPISAHSQDASEVA